MSHNLTQPEEIDLIWMAMAKHDVEEDMPIPGWMQLCRTIQNTEHTDSARRAFSGHRAS